MAGFLLNPISFPPYLRIIGYTSPYQYAFAAMAVVEYKDNEYDCPYPPTNPICQQFDGMWLVSRRTGTDTHTSVLARATTGNYVLSQQNLIFDTIMPNLLILSAMAIAYRIIGLLILVQFKRKPQS